MDAVIAARLDLIAAKAKILSENYKNVRMWDGDLREGLNEIEREIRMIRNGDSGGWATSRSDWQGDR